MHLFSRFNYVLLVICIWTFVPLQLLAQVPSQPTNYITDVGNYIEDGLEKQLNDTLAAFEQASSHQIFVLISGTTEGQDIDA